MDGWQTAPGGVGAMSLPDTVVFSRCQAAGEGHSGEPYLGLHLDVFEWEPVSEKAITEVVA